MYRKLMWLRGRPFAERMLVVAAPIVLRVGLWLWAPAGPYGTAVALVAVMVGGALMCRRATMVIAVVTATAPWFLTFVLHGIWYGGWRSLYVLVPWSLLAVGLAQVAQAVTDRAGLLDALAADSGERMVLLDRKGRIIFATKASVVSTRAGFGRAEGRPIFDFLAEWFRPVAKQMLEAALAGGGLQQTPIFVMKQCGRRVPVVVSAKPLHYRGETFVLGVTRDVTGPEPTQRLFSCGFDSTDIRITLRDREGRVIWCNQAFADLCGCTKDEVVGTLASPSGLFREDKAGIMAELAAGRPVFTERTLGEDRIVEFRGYPLKNPDGSLFASVWFASDVTEKKQAAARMVQAERMAAVGQVAAGVAHNLNNVLGAISANAELLSLSPDPAVANVAEEILVAVAHGSTMIRNLYELKGRRRSPELAPVNVADVAGSVLQLLSAQIRQHEIAVAVAVPERLAVLADVHLLRQVLMNLMLNSLQAMPQGGRLEVSAGITPAGTVALSVTDNGCGIPPEHMDRLFEPFFTTKGAVNGTGLGLPTSRVMLRAMGGDVQVRSVPGEGTMVTVELPVPAQSEGR